MRRPQRQGLYDPSHEHDACGVGFVAHIKGRRSHELVGQAIEVLVHLEHRGACGCDPETGDGAGILIQLPDRFLRAEAGRLGFELPEAGRYASGLVFLDQDPGTRRWQEQAFAETVQDEGQTLLGWRDVPNDPAAIGWLARGAMPVIRQAFVAAAPGHSADAFERSLYVIRRSFENAARERGGFFYVPSLSSRTFAYTGMLMSTQLDSFYADLRNSDLDSAIGLVHSRYSTNTFPNWDLAQPFRYLAHNGEINTLKGNRNYMQARQGTLRSDLFGEDLQSSIP